MCAITVVEEIEAVPATSYGATDDRDSVQQSNTIHQSPSTSDAVCRQWDLHYREAALYLKVSFCYVLHTISSAPLYYLQGLPKTRATLHFPKYLENYQR